MRAVRSIRVKLTEQPATKGPEVIETRSFDLMKTFRRRICARRRAGVDHVQWNGR